MKKENFKNLSFDALVEYLKTINEKSFRAKQLFEWVYQKGVEDFDRMTNLPADFRARLREKFLLSTLTQLTELRSADGTVKYLFQLDDGEKIETVLIPAKTRATVCVSTQAGCKFRCRFCASGLGGWTRDLTAAEIVSQVLKVKDLSKNDIKQLTHVVFMGTGEPLDNFDNLMKSIRIINDKNGLNIGARRITVSTCGIIPKIRQLSKEGLQIEISISLHGYNNESRDVLMPVNRTYPFNDLIDACRDYVNETRRQITFEYILIKDITCTEQAVECLKKSFKGLICKINLIPYNPIPEFDYKTPSRQEVISFQKRLQESGIHATIRAPRGKDINGACGQLRYKS